MTGWVSTPSLDIEFVYTSENSILDKYNICNN